MASRLEDRIYLDVSNEADWERLAARFPRFDLLAACAGISEAKPLTGTTLSDWQRVMSVNLDGAFLSVKYGARAMQQNGGGAIVLVGSASGIKTSAGASAYCASKAALRMLARKAALEFKSQGIRVNCVSPTAVVTRVECVGWPLTRLRRRCSGWHFQKKSQRRSCFSAAISRLTLQVQTSSSTLVIRYDPVVNRGQEFLDRVPGPADLCVLRPFLMTGAMKMHKNSGSSPRAGYRDDPRNRKER